jgi:hypothetical protein
MLTPRNNRRRLAALGASTLLSAALTSGTASAADHTDSPAATAEPSADITDVYTWMTPDAEHVNLVMNVAPFSAADASFSDAITYVFHVNSAMGYGMEATETTVACQFYDTDAIECWVGDNYLTGDPSDPAGITSEDGSIRVFAGPRDDPFFFELTGFTNAVAAVVAAAPALGADDAGCPNVDAETSGVLVGLLQSGTDGAAASDTLAGANVLSLVVQVDKSALTAGGPLLGVWGSTHAAE